MNQMSNRTRGTCRYCGKAYTRTPMAKHVLTCKERGLAAAGAINENLAGHFVLLINDKYDKQYWLIVEMKETTSLKDLDQFLRDIWLECCGHLSNFYIEGVQYESDPHFSDGWGMPVKGMNIKLMNLLEPGMVIDYTYDYGSSTELSVSVLAQRMGPAKREKVAILSRNQPVTFVCQKCEKKIASKICRECIYEGEGLLCEDCLKDHPCDEEMLTNILNSPRAGVCGYEGSDKYPD